MIQFIPALKAELETIRYGTVGMFDIYIYVFYPTSTVIMPQYGRPGHLHTVGMVRYGTVATHSKGIACAIYISRKSRCARWRRTKLLMHIGSSEYCT